MKDTKENLNFRQHVNNERFTLLKYRTEQNEFYSLNV